ncbi:hypothetical protein CALCODRAFT_99969 [Calocera cornea HHB12733]|uniref:Complex 1 LYR protein n=1 Tax=Calocera cornea HHB12733 TaxID=1353952 RepID=A0A165D6V7_9BASI|nr:hypothetical protein CALCODRAFT_99969 [Calocera cornea HHB12733]
MSTPRSLYRSILRELRKSATTPRAQRSPAIVLHLRRVFTAPGKTPQALLDDAQNALTFLHSQRTYKELLARYSPLSDLTPEERVKLTARRVGLDTPREHDPLAPGPHPNPGVPDMATALGLIRK